MKREQFDSAKDSSLMFTAKGNSTNFAAISTRLLLKLQYSVKSVT